MSPSATSLRRIVGALTRCTSRVAIVWQPFFRWSPRVNRPANDTCPARVWSRSRVRTAHEPAPNRDLEEGVEWAVRVIVLGDVPVVFLEEGVDDGSWIRGLVHRRGAFGDHGHISVFQAHRYIPVASHVP